MRRIIALLAVVLVLTVLVSGCVITGEAVEKIESQEEATGAVMNMSEDIEDVSSTLEELEGLFEE